MPRSDSLDPRSCRCIVSKNNSIRGASISTTHLGIPVQNPSAREQDPLYSIALRPLPPIMRYTTLLTIMTAAFSTTAEARRWRFAFPFPGKIEPSIPEPVHMPYENLEEKEKLYDAKQVSRRTRKGEVSVGPKTMNDKIPEVAPKIPWMM